jgi:glycyl-tRNA synthetase
MFVQERDDMCGVDAAILMNPKVWEASGHVSGFSDPLVECKKCKRRFRADQVENKCPECEGAFGDVRQFNMMFKTHVGAAEDESSVSYLRPETAGGIFTNFKNVVDSIHPKLPFGIAQIGKAFRNEIAPRDFIFRSREFEQMEIEYFVHSDKWKDAFEMWRKSVHAFNEAVGIIRSAVYELEVPDGERAHYSKRTIDFEFDFPFGRKELYGLAYRTDFDLSAHAKSSGVDLSYLDEQSGKRFIPHVIEPSFGVDRTILALLVSAYTEDKLGGEPRVYLKFNKTVAPIKAAVFPLLKNKPELVAKAREVYMMLKKSIPQVMWDDNGNIGKRYRRQDEIGTPSCVTIDFQTLEDDTVTLRNRDTGAQERVAVSEVIARVAT